MTVRIAFVGEAYGEQEEKEKRPFVGASGKVLNAMLAEVGIDRREALVTNVFNLRPPGGNSITNLCGPKKYGIPGYPSLQQGKYPLAMYKPELDRLYAELEAANPNLIVAFGNTPAWALLKRSGITKLRGYFSLTHPDLPLSRRFKVLPTFHPTYIMRSWSDRPIGLADLHKARSAMDTPDLVWPDRDIYLAEEVSDLYDFEQAFIRPNVPLSTDVETWADQVTWISFAPDPHHSLVIPFFSKRHADGNYWRSAEDEIAVWKFVKRLCETHPMIGQNFLYDVHRLWRGYGIKAGIVGVDDTMLMHHAHMPEMKKGLGLLGSLYADIFSWKYMREDIETLKRED